MTTTTTSPLLRPNRLPQKGVAMPKFDLESIWEAVGFVPHEGQREIFRGWAVHEVTTAVCGTRFGKSELAAHLPLAYIAPCRKKVYEDGRVRYVEHRTTGAIIAPIYKLTSIIMDKLYGLVVKLCRLLGYSTNKPPRTKFYDIDEAIEDAEAIEAEPNVLTVRRVNGVIQTIITPWGNRIDAFTMENPKGLLGVSFDWIITDESGQFQAKEWSNYFEYADRALLDRKGWVYHGTTPKGFNDLYDRFFVPGQPGAHRNGDYISFQMPTSKNTHLDPDWLEKKRKTTPPRLWRMNYLAQFTVLDGQVYEEFSRDTHVRTFEPRPEWQYFLGMDFGFTDPFVCQLWAWTGEVFACIDEVYGPGLTFEQQHRAVVDMVGRHKPPTSAWLHSKDGKWTAWVDPRNPQARAEWIQKGIMTFKSPVRMKGAGRNEIEATAQIVAEFLHPVEGRPYPEPFARVGDNAAPEAPQVFIHERCKETIHSLMSWVKAENHYEGPDHGCFVAGTRITCERGSWKPIEEIRVGEEVWTRQGYRRVVDAAMTDKAAEIWELRDSWGGTLRGTYNHPIFVVGRGFVPLSELSPGDQLKYDDSIDPYGEVVSVHKTGEKSPVYNITVEDAHEYFAEGILVHNCDSLRYALIGARHYALPITRGQERRYDAPQGQKGPKRIPTRLLKTKSGGKLGLGTR